MKRVVSAIEIRTEKVEITSRIKLNSDQRLTLVKLQSAGGTMSVGKLYCAHRTREQLEGLGLIARCKLLDTEQKVREAEKRVKTAWVLLGKAVLGRDIGKVSDALDDVNEAKAEIRAEAWRLTEAGREYLVKGKVVVTR